MWYEPRDNRHIFRFVNNAVTGNFTYDDAHVAFVLNAISPIFQTPHVHGLSTRFGKARVHYNSLLIRNHTGNSDSLENQTFTLHRQRYIRIWLFESELDEILQKHGKNMYDTNILPLISVYIEFGE